MPLLVCFLSKGMHSWLCDDKISLMASNDTFDQDSIEASVPIKIPPKTGHRKRESIDASSKISAMSYAANRRMDTTMINEVSSHPVAKRDDLDQADNPFTLDLNQIHKLPQSRCYTKRAYENGSERTFLYYFTIPLAAIADFFVLPMVLMVFLCVMFGHEGEKLSGLESWQRGSFYIRVMLDSCGQICKEGD